MTGAQECDRITPVAEVLLQLPLGHAARQRDSAVAAIDPQSLYVQRLRHQAEHGPALSAGGVVDVHGLRHCRRQW
jgi:hypothetical protein